MSRKFDIVVTTIFEPQWLSGYLDNLRKHGHDRDTTIRIVTDQKTPATVYAAAAAARQQGFLIDCPTLDEQTAYLAKLGLDEKFIPWNTDNRRNIGYLRAWESGADVMISIDDDNYCRGDSDFIGEHARVGAAVNASSLNAADGAPWFNNCALLESQLQDAFFPRGFPVAARRSNQIVERYPAVPAGDSRRIAVNAGMWLDDPDVDAMSRLTQAPRVTSAKPLNVAMGAQTWCPVNTQNTALLREAMPAYYYARMGYPLEGMRIDRYGDILSGYFLQACAKAQGDAICFGGPVADHKRSPHNLFKDLYFELAGMVIVEDLLPWMRELKLPGAKAKPATTADYSNAYAALADALDQQAGHMKGFIWDQGGAAFLRDTAACMRRWLQVLETLN